MMSRYTAMCFLTLGTTIGLAEEPRQLRADDKPMSAIAVGDKAPNKNSLRDLRGNRRALHDFKDHRALVLVFLGADCPISNLYTPGLLDLEKKYRSKDVQFLALYANEQEDLDQVAMHSYDRGIPFPVLKDFGQRLAGVLGVERVPAVVVLDKDFVLRYRGRINDRYGAGVRRKKATRDDLAEAIEDVLAGKKVRVAETEADGCLLDRAATRRHAKASLTPSTSRRSCSSAVRFAIVRIRRRRSR